MIEKLRNNPDVELVEPNYIIRASATPNDPQFPSLWGLLNTGQVVDGRTGTPGADIAAVPAWDYTTGSRSNVVAVIDSGIDYTHPDLAANVWAAPRAFTVTLGSRTISCAAGTRGYNAVAKTCDPMDDNGHGTHVAGIIGAVGNNGVGITGVSWNASMMALKILGVDGLGTIADAVEAVDFIVETKAALGADANVRVINASWGVDEFSEALDAEIAIANNHEILFVASAGSEGQNNDANPHYPASGVAANIISVGSIDNTGALAGHSNYGASAVDLAAPGDSTLSTLPNGGYGTMSGSSMAAPFVSGAAALVLARCPSTTAQLKSRLMAGVDTHPSLQGKTVTGGSLNVQTVLQNCVTGTATISVNPTTVSPGGAITANVTHDVPRRNDWIGLYSVSANDATFIDWMYFNGTKTAPASAMGSATVTFTAPSTVGTYNLRVFANGGYTRIATSADIIVANQPTVSINDSTVAEGNIGATVMTFTVSLSHASSQTVTVNYATASGTAAAGSDFTPANGTLNFSPGALTRQFTVSVTGDTNVETTETLTVNLSSPINASIGDGQGLGTITNDDQGPPTTLSVVPSTVGPGGIFNAQITDGPGGPRDWIALYQPGAADTSFIEWSYFNGQKTPPATGSSNITVQFPAPTAPGSYELRVFANGGYTRLASASVGVASQPSLRISDVTVTEGNSDTVLAVFNVTLTPASASTVTVAYATASGTATSGSDFVAASGTLTFSPSATSQTISVVVNGDTVVEPTENFQVNLSNATNSVIVDGQGVGTIATDDGAVTTSLTVNPSTVAPGGTINAQVSNGPGNRTDWIALYQPGAADGSFIDWAYLNGQKTAPASGSSTITVMLPAPTTLGNYELRLFSNNGYTRLATAPLTVATAPSLSISDATVTEGNSGTTTATFTVTLSSASSQTVTVAYATANGSATAGSDYVAASGSLTFSPSTVTQTINVTINGDTTIEASETFSVTLSSPVNAVLADGTGIGTIANDENSGTTSIQLSSTTVANGGVIGVTINNATGDARAWLGLYPSGASDFAFVDWSYLNGQKTVPASGATGTVTLNFPAPAQSGSYELRLFANGGYTRLATSATITVGSQAPASGPSLTVNTPSVPRGGTIEIAINNGPGQPLDWLALYVPSAADGNFIDWSYWDGSKTRPTTGQANAIVRFTAPTVAGTYEVRLFTNNSYTKVATSGTITVTQ
jgi:subtilisin family serine protease